MEKWKKILSESITDSATLSKFIDIDRHRLDRIIERYPIRINPYYLQNISCIWEIYGPNLEKLQHYNFGLNRGDFR